LAHVAFGCEDEGFEAVGGVFDLETNERKESAASLQIDPRSLKHTFSNSQTSIKRFANCLSDSRPYRNIAHRD
jgi:hypothetical protein